MKMVGIHIFGIIHLPHGVMLPVHLMFIVDFSEWGKAAAVVLTCVSHRFFIVCKSSLIDVIIFWSFVQ